MLALIAGTGDLPVALAARLKEAVLVCAMEGFPPNLPVDLSFRIEHLGSFLQVLKGRGVTRVCMAGAIRRPKIDPSEIDAETYPLVPTIQAAIAAGDDGALRAVIGIFEDAGIKVIGADEIAPNLLPPSGVLTIAQPSAQDISDALIGDATLTEMGAADSGQACLIRGEVRAREDADGTDAMLTRYVQGKASGAPEGGILFKGPKPGQDRRADLPVIGSKTAGGIIAAGLSGIVIEEGGVMVLDLPQLIAALDDARCFLWVRPRGGA